MRSTFFGFEIAKSGLFVSQKQLDVTGHNIANANTIGYSRQRLVTTNVEPNMSQLIFKPFEYGAVGLGVTSVQVDQIRNPYLDRNFRYEYTNYGEWVTRANEMERIESLFDVLASGTALNTVYDSFFNSLQDVSQDQNVANSEAREAAISQAVKLAQSLNHYSQNLYDMQVAENDQIKVLVDNINSIAKKITELNKQIYGFELSGDMANDLRDKRNLLLDELSGYTNMTYGEVDGRLWVEIGGQQLLDHVDAYEIIVEQSDPSAEPRDPATGMLAEGLKYRIMWNGGTEVDIRSGEVAARLNMRDGDLKENMGIPYIMEQLNLLTRELAKTFNDIHMNGYGTNGETGLCFFVEMGNDGSTEPDYTMLHAGNLQVATMMTDKSLGGVANFAASTTLVDMSSDNTQIGNNFNMTAIIDALNAHNYELSGKVVDFIKGLIVDIAIDTSFARDMASAEEVLCTDLSNQRMSIMGVSIDEELTDMVRFQHAYNACARMITAMDENLDTLINRTGRVGL